MAEKLASTTSHAATDLKITFEKGGESFSLYFKSENLKDPAVNKEMGDYVKCALCCSQKQGFGACMARCVVDGQCCDGGISNCTGT